MRGSTSKGGGGGGGGRVVTSISACLSSGGEGGGGGKSGGGGMGESSGERPLNGEGRGWRMSVIVESNTPPVCVVQKRKRQRERQVISTAHSKLDRDIRRGHAWTRA